MRPKFKKGNKFGKGGRKTPPGGRPTKQVAALKAMTPELIRAYVLERIKPVVDAWIALGANGMFKVDGRSKRLKLDPATVRDIIDKFLPPAPKTLNLDLTKTAEDYYSDVMADAGVDITEDQKQIEPPVLDKEKMN